MKWVGSLMKLIVERGYKLSEKLNLKINKNEWSNQKQDPSYLLNNHISV